MRSATAPRLGPEAVVQVAPEPPPLLLARRDQAAPALLQLALSSLARAAAAACLTRSPSSRWSRSDNAVPPPGQNTSRPTGSPR